MRKFVVFCFFVVFVIFLFTIGISVLVQPNDGTVLTEHQKETVMNIALTYVEEKYDSDYLVNGNVTISSYVESRPNGETTYTFPVASFRVPADYNASGLIVDFMIDLETEEIVKVLTLPSKSCPPPTPE